MSLDTKPLSSAAGVETPTPARPMPLGDPRLRRHLPSSGMNPATSFFLHALVIALALLFLTPLGWSLMTSLKSQDQFAREPMALPDPPRPQNYRDAFVTPDVPPTIATVQRPSGTDQWENLYANANIQFSDTPGVATVGGTNVPYDVTIRFKQPLPNASIGDVVLVRTDRYAIRTITPTADPDWPVEVRASLIGKKDVDNFRKFRFPLYVLNTLVITQLVVIGTVFSSSLVAYGFARFDFPFKKTLFALLISTMLLPGQVTMIPVFMIWNYLGFVDTIIPLTLPAFLGGGAFNVFLLRQFYMQLPRSLDEAAMIDGCSPFGIWWRILMPLSKPALITVGLFAFTHSWEDFMGPLIYLHDPNKYTVSVGLRLFNDEYGNSNLPLLMASSLLHIAPVVILFLVAQKYFVRGIATSGLKD